MNKNAMGRWRRNAGPALGLLAAGVVVGAILSNSVSAVAADDGATPSPSASSGSTSADVEDGTASTAGAKADCPEGQGGRFEGRARVQGGHPRGGMRGDLRVGPERSSEQNPGQVQSPTSYLTF